MDEKTICATRKTIYELKPVVQGKTMKIKKLPSDVCPYIVQDPKTKKKKIQVMKQPEPRPPACPTSKPTTEWTATCTTSKPETEWIPKRDYDYSTTNGCSEAIIDLVAFLDEEKRAGRQGLNDYYESKIKGILEAMNDAIADYVALQRKITAERRKRRAEKWGINYSLVLKPEETQGINNSVPHTLEVINLVDDDEDEKFSKKSKSLFTESTTSPEVINLVDDDEDDAF
jgi:hypothetical protein